MPKKVVGVRRDKDGDVTGVLLEGNKTVTPLKTAVVMAEAGKIKDVHAVKPVNGRAYLRSNPDDSVGNNLDNLPEK